MRPIVAVDPGGRRTGIVVRRGPTLDYWALLTRNSDVTFDWYLGEVVDTVTKARDHARNLQLADHGRPLLDTDIRGGLTPITIAVEDLNDPTPHMGVVAVRGLIDTGQVIGAIAGHWPITRIPPADHGSHHLGVYPAQLVDEREKQGRGRLRHVRAAWDIAAHARTVIGYREEADS